MVVYHTFRIERGRRYTPCGISVSPEGSLQKKVILLSNIYRNSQQHDWELEYIIRLSEFKRV